MVANTAADRDKGISTADYIRSFGEAPLGGESQIFRDIYTRRAGMLAGSTDKTLADGGTAGF